MKIVKDKQGAVMIVRYTRDGRKFERVYLGYSEKEALKEFNTEYRYIMKYRPWSV